jgi:hypothetical protein
VDTLDVSYDTTAELIERCYAARHPRTRVEGGRERDLAVCLPSHDLVVAAALRAMSAGMRR